MEYKKTISYFQKLSYACSNWVTRMLSPVNSGSCNGSMCTANAANSNGSCLDGLVLSETPVEAV